MALRDDLLNAEPGQVLEFTGTQRLGKIVGVKGTAEAPIILRGADDSAVLSAASDYLYACARFEQCAWLRLERFRVDGEGRAQRGLQIWPGEQIELCDLEIAGCRYDLIHVAGANHVAVRRIYGDGSAGVDMGGGKGPHLLYFTRIDGGPDCTDLVGEDLDCVGVWGAAFQANGDGARLRGVVFRRCRAESYGRLGGSGVNLAQCVSPLLEDITLRPHAANDNPGVASYDGTTGTVMRRYDIECEELSSGPMSAVQGTPALPLPPNFDTAPEPPEPEPLPPSDEWMERALAAEAEVARLSSLITEAEGVLARA